MTGDPFEPSTEVITNASNAQIFERDGGKCCRCGRAAESVHHRVHGKREDRRPSNLLSACGSGTTKCHGWFEAHPRDSRTMGWTASRHSRDNTKTPVWMEAGTLGRGWYLLNDQGGLTLVEAA